MRATKLEFRIRMAIITAIIILGFAAPWIESARIGSRMPTLEWLPLELSRLGLLGFAAATPAVIIAGSLIAAVSALFRIWGAAYLGPATVASTSMRAGAVMADGPYRFVRNPLYIGLWFMMLALALMMPPTGALFAIVLISVFIVRLTLGEEAFLSEQLGEPYRAYIRAVPRWFPRVRSAVVASGAEPHWVRAILSETTPLGVFVALVLFAWTYNHQLMVRVVLIGLGISLVVRALMPGALKQNEDAAR